ncbi:UNVERIFIED_CONTAM: hypothetical protein Sangu_3159600 [Sesamum angustifolium]|uniref:Uncharacterized protein n=1 Tax=Sesamum angustifolium TaxID=2727405 RepID=A0AAW2JVK4_9LAMI
MGKNDGRGPPPLSFSSSLRVERDPSTNFHQGLGRFSKVHNLRRIAGLRHRFLSAALKAPYSLCRISHRVLGSL